MYSICNCRALLDLNIDLPEDKAQMALKNICKHINCTVRELRRLFLIEDLVDSMKVNINRKNEK